MARRGAATMLRSQVGSAALTTSPARVNCTVGPLPPQPIQLACASNGTTVLRVTGAIPEPSTAVDYVSIELADAEDEARRPRVHFSSAVSALGRFAAMVPLHGTDLLAPGVP